MASFKKSKLLVLSILILLSACSTGKKIANASYVPDDPELYRTILGQDSIFFKAYNTCDIGKQAMMYNDNIEFYHDNGGLTTNKEDILESIRKNICGKVTRELVAGSVEVYPVKNFGAVEIGLHTFYNNIERPGIPSRPGKFIIIWQNKNNAWFINRVVSLH
jgi:hypothetical protein